MTPTGALVSTNSIDALLDAFAHAVTQDPVTVTGQRPTDPPIAIATAVSRTTLDDSHSKHTATALLPLLDTAQARHPQALNGRQLHLMFAIAAADLLEPDRMAAFLDSYIDPGIDIWYMPMRVSALRTALTTVLGPYEPAKRARLLTSLAEHTNRELVHYAPSDTPFNPEFLAHFAQDANGSIRQGVARNKHLDPSLHAQLANDQDERVRWALAGNASLDPSLQTTLANDPVSGVRVALATNASLDPSLHAQLANDPVSGVREMLARYAHLDPSLQTKLANDPVSGVRQTLAVFAHLDPDLQIHLANDPDPRVREALAGNDRLLPELVPQLFNPKSTLLNHHMGVAANPQLDLGLQRRLSRNPYTLVLSALAGNPNLSPKIQSRLARVRDSLVRTSLASNPNLSPRIQSRLARVRDSEVRTALASNPNLSPKIQSRLARRPIAGVPDESARGMTDPHGRYRCAVGDGSVQVRTVAAGAVERLAQAHVAVNLGARPKPHMVKDADSLPSLDDVPYPTAPGAQARLDHAAEQHGVPVHVLTTGREQRHNGRVMDNCTLSDSYVRTCQEGTKIVAVFEHAGRPYNIAWRYISGTWWPTDLAGQGNSQAPKVVHKLAEDLTMLLAGLEPVAPTRDTTADTLAALVIDVPAAADLAHTEPSPFTIA